MVVVARAVDSLERYGFERYGMCIWKTKILRRFQEKNFDKLALGQYLKHRAFIFRKMHRNVKKCCFKSSINITMSMTQKPENDVSCDH